jgi:hypothetical protein
VHGLGLILAPPGFPPPGLDRLSPRRGMDILLGLKASTEPETSLTLQHYYFCKLRGPRTQSLSTTIFPTNSRFRGIQGLVPPLGTRSAHI